MVKPVLAGEGRRRRPKRRAACCAVASKGRVALLHPFMPFLTEEIWEKLTGRPGTLIVSALPARATGRGETRRPSRRSRPCGRSSRGSATSGPSAARRRPSRSPSRSIRPRRTGLSWPGRRERWRGLLSHLARLVGPALRSAPPPGAFPTWWPGSRSACRCRRAPRRTPASESRSRSRAADEEIAALRAKLAERRVPREGPGPPWSTRRGARLFELEEKRAALVRS